MPPRFFLPKKEALQDVLVLRGEDARHVGSSLRMRAGDRVTICNGDRLDALCEIRSIEKGTVHLQVLSRSTNAAEPSCSVTLYQCLPKGDKMEQIVQKAVELGVFSVVPVLSERCVSRPDSASIERKLARWKQVSMEAAKQCGRGIVPTVRDLHKWDDALEMMAVHKHAWMLYEGHNGNGLPQSLKADAEMGLLVGPEGGFSTHEVEQASQRGIHPVRFGKRILRTETAGPAALAVVAFLSGNLS